MKKAALIIGTCLFTSVLAAAGPVTQPSESASKTLDRMLGGTKPAVPLPAPASTSRIDAATTRPGVAPSTPAAPLMREGTLLRDRIGRIVRSADGSQIEFIFDSDGTNLKDPPVVILPNKMLFSMEQAIAGVKRDLRFRITGMVTEYRSRNYVLLDKVMVVGDNDARF